MKNEFAERFKGLRKERSLTQEQLAAEFGVTVQAVSKWETAASYPDIEIIAEIAKFFDVSIDYLLGKGEMQPACETAELEEDVEPTCKICEDEKQEEAVRCIDLDSIQDDNVLRVILCRGRKILYPKEYVELEIPLVINGGGGKCRIEVYGNAKISDEVHGDVVTYGNLYCGIVRGDLIAAGSIECDGTVDGDAKAAGSVNCRDVDGDVRAGGNINCGDVNGDLSAGSNINCGNIMGDAKAGGIVECGDVSGDVTSRSGSLACGDVAGDVSATGSVSCKTVAGDANTAFSSVNCGNVGGDVKAGTSIACGYVAGDVNAGSWVTCENVEGDVNAGGNVTASRVDGSVAAGCGRGFTSGMRRSSNSRNDGENAAHPTEMPTLNIGERINRAVEEAIGKIDFDRHFGRKYEDKSDRKDYEDFGFNQDEQENEE